MDKDYRKNQKIIKTLKLEDKGQDFTEIDILENGVILGNSVMFKNGRLSMIGIGTLDGKKYYTFNEIKLEKDIKNNELKNLYIYIKDTKDKKEPLPWKAQTLNYKII